MMPNSSTKQERYEIVNLVALFLMLWIAIDLWGRVYRNFTLNQLGLDPNSTSDSLVMAGIWTLVLFVFFFSSKKLASYGELITSGSRISSQEDHSN